MAISEAPRPIEQTVSIEKRLLDEGMEILPPFTDTLPEIQIDVVTRLIGKKRMPTALTWMESIKSYPTVQAVYDARHDVHEENTPWRHELEAIYTREAVEEQLGSRNPFRRQAMTSVQMAMQMLGKHMDPHAVSDEDVIRIEKLFHLADDVNMMVNGINPRTGREICTPYELLTDRDEKIAVKDYVAEKCVEALQLFAKPHETTLF